MGFLGSLGTEFSEMDCIEVNRALDTATYYVTFTAL